MYINAKKKSMRKHLIHGQIIDTSRALNEYSSETLCALPFSMAMTYALREMIIIESVAAPEVLRHFGVLCISGS